MTSGADQLRVELRVLPPAAMQALLERDLARASDLTGLALPPFFAEEEGWLWEIRTAQVARDPVAVDWVVRAAVAPDGTVVGHAGFHGPPDDDGAVEVGYTVLPELRGRGWATACLAALLERARQEPGVVLVRASVSPDNAASLAVVRGAGFAHVGEVEDEQDGLELVFELSVGDARP